MKSDIKFFLAMVMSLSMSFGLFAEDKPKRVVLDRIMARVNGANVLLSDLVQKRINSDEAFNVDRVVTSKLYYQEALRKDILPKALEIEKRIASLKSAANLSDITDEVFEREYLLQEGFTLKQYKREMSRLLTEGQLLGSVQQERIFITSDEVKEYYEKNPQWMPIEYSLALAYCKASSAQEALEQKDTVTWSNIGWLKESEIASKFKAVCSVDPGTVIDPIESGSEYQLVKLVDKKEAQLVPLEHRYSKIELALRKEKAKNFEEGYQQELRAKANIVYLNPIQELA